MKSGNLNEVHLYETAKNLDTNTLYGSFNIDRKTGIQVGHKMKVTKWVNGSRNLIKFDSI